MPTYNNTYSNAAASFAGQLDVTVDFAGGTNVAVECLCWINGNKRPQSVPLPDQRTPGRRKDTTQQSFVMGLGQHRSTRQEEFTWPRPSPSSSAASWSPQPAS